MDGAVPIIYIVLAIGVLVSCFMSVRVIYTCLNAKENSHTNAELIAKRNLIISVFLLLLWVIAKDTVIGHGPLLYLMPGIFALSIFVWWLARHERYM